MENNAIDQNLHHFEWQLSIQEKVLRRKLATKSLEDEGDKQSACSQVLVRQISQLAIATSGDSWQLMKSVASASCCICSSTCGRTAKL
jgi:hypothetical protein